MGADTPHIYDWNKERSLAPIAPVTINDETLRDGLQAPSVFDPSTHKKLELLHLMEEVGIHSVNIGLPGASRRATMDAYSLAMEIRDARLAIQANCAARTVISDIQPLADLVQQVGHPVMASIFIGSSEIRRVTEQWDLEFLMKRTQEAVSFAVQQGLEVMYITEDTTRAHPDTLASLYRAAVDAGATRLCLCDTVGHADPEGTRALVQWVRALLAQWQVDVRMDWHGHNDRGLALVNALAAAQSGVDQIHACALGIGERTGNTATEQVVVNLWLMDRFAGEPRLEALPSYVEKAAEALGMTIPSNAPVVGSDAFNTATGVHAAAVAKALQRNDRALADAVYSGVPASVLGRQQDICVGPMSGRANVKYCLIAQGIEPTPHMIEAVFEAAKASRTVLSPQQIHDIARGNAKTA